MRSAFARVVAVCLIALPAFAESGTLKGHSQDPIFIPAASLYAAEGQFSDEVPSGWRGSIRRFAGNLQSPPDRLPIHSAAAPCGGMYLGEDDVESPVRRDSSETALSNARAIFTGRIRSVTPGFFYGSPGSLIELGSVVPLKNTSYPNVGDTVFVRHPYAQFRAGAGEYCRENRPGAYVPHVGDQLIVFAFAAPMDEQGLLVYSHFNDVIAQASTGRAHVPPLLRFFSSGDDGIADVATRIRQTLRRADHGRNGQPR